MTNKDVIHGEDFIIEVLVGAAYKVMLCATDGTLRYTQEIITTTTENSGIWKGKAPRLNEATLSVSGLTPIQDDDTHVSWFYLMSDAVRILPQSIRATFTNGNGETKVISGTAIIASGEITGNADDFASSTIEFEFSDALTMSDEVTPGPPTPTPLDTPALVLTVDSDTQITASWAAVTNASSYILLMSTVNDITFASVKFTGTGLSKVLTRLTPSTTYYFWLQAVGTGLYSNSAYDTDSATTDAATPVAITLPSPSFSMVANGSDQIDATWSSVANATAYEFYFNDTDDFGTATLEYSGTNLTKSVTGLTANTTYYGWVIAKGDGVDYLDSPAAEASANTDAVDDSTVFDTILTAPGFAIVSDQAAGVFAFFGLDDVKQFQFDAISQPSGTNVRLGIKVSGAAGCVVDFPGSYVGQPFRYVHSDSSEHLGTFPATNTTIDF